MPMPNLPMDAKEGAREARALRDLNAESGQLFQYQPEFGQQIGAPAGPMPDMQQEEQAQANIEQAAPYVNQQLEQLSAAMNNPVEFLRMTAQSKEEEVSLDTLTGQQKDKILKSFIRCRDVANNYYREIIEPEILHRRDVYYADKEYYKEKYPQLSELCGWVSKDVKTACDWLLPTFMEVFTGSDDPVSVKGVNIEDDYIAEKIQQLVRYELEKKNDYHQWVMAEINDALKENWGIAKVWWNREEKRTPYEVMLDSNDGMSTMAFVQAVSSGAIEMKKMDILPEAPDFAKVQYEEVEVVENHPVVEYIPSSELRYTPDAPTLQECKFVAHRKIVRGDYLKRKERDGLFSNVDIALEEYTDGNMEPSVLDRANDEHRYDKINRPNDNDLASKEVELYEAYINVDYNNDGIFEHLIVHAVGDHLIKVTENDFDHAPFFVCSILKDPNIVFSPESLPTNFEQIQDLKTAMVRQVIVNVTKNNSPRYFVNEQKADLDAMYNNEEVISVQGNPAEAVFVPPSLPLSSITMSLVEYAQNELESQSGSTRYNQGLDSNSLNKTATGVTAIMGASEKRNKLLARALAESFFIPVYKHIIRMNQLYLEDQQMIRLTNESVMIRREELDIDYDLIINVGQGAGTREAQIQYYLYMLNTVYPILTQQNIVNPSSWYSLVKKLLEAMGIRDVTPFLIDPNSPQAQQAAQEAQQKALEAQAQQFQQAIQMAIAKASVPRVTLNMSDMPADAVQQYLEKQLGIVTTEQAITEHEILNQ